MLSSIEAVVNGGKAVISADNGVITAMMQEALQNGRSATFYVPPAQGDALMRWDRTPGRIKEIGMEPVSPEEKARYRAPFRVQGLGPHVLQLRPLPVRRRGPGMFEFIQQGIRQHERDWIKVVMDLTDTSVVRINPAIDTLCPECRLDTQTCRCAPE